MAALRDDRITRCHKQVIVPSQALRNSTTGSEEVNLRLKLTDAVQDKKELARSRWLKLLHPEVRLRKTKS